MRFVLLASLVFTPSFLGCVPQNRVHGPSAVSKVSFFPDPVSQSTPSPTHPSAEAATGVQFSSRPASAHSAASEPVSSDSVYEKSIPVLISFGQISGYFSAEWARALSGYVRSSNCEQVGAREYRCGEFPVGQVVSDSSKLLMSIPIPAQSGKEDGVSYSTASATASLLLDRNQVSGSVDIPSLDYLSPGNVFVSKSLGEAVFLKLDPRGGELLTSVCFGIPGLRALIPTVTIDGRVRKSITLLPDIKGTFKVRADIGSVQVGVSKICSDIEISQVADGSFEARLLRLGKLEVQAVDISGMKVSVDADVSGIWGFINKITSFFGLDIENRIAEAVRKESSSALKSQIELSSREIRSGQWLQRYLTEGYVQNLLNRATRQMNSNLAQAGFGAREVEAMVQGSCLSLASSAAGFSNQLKAQFFKICRSSVSVKLQHFLEDRNSRVSGCHDYYFAPAHQQWWSNRCFLKSDATVQIKLFSRVPSIDELQQCISSSWGSVTGLTQCGAQARSVIQELTAGSLADIPAVTSLPPPSPEQITRMKNFLDRSGSQLPDVSTIRAIWN